MKIEVLYIAKSAPHSSLPGVITFYGERRNRNAPRMDYLPRMEVECPFSIRSGDRLNYPSNLNRIGYSKIEATHSDGAWKHPRRALGYGILFVHK